MRYVYSIVGSAVLLVLTSLVPTAGCFFHDNFDCEHYPGYGCSTSSSGAGGSTTTTGAGGMNGSGGTGGGAPSCVPSENDKAVADTCGVFVSSSTGEDGKDRGAKDKPFKTLSAAIMAGAEMKKTVYACGELFKEAVTISSGITVYGALDCAKGWVYQADKKTGLTAEPDAVPLTLTSAAGGTAIHDFSITAADAMADGGSSIAVIDDQADLVLEDVALIAGMGKAGAIGALQDQVVTPVDAKGGDGANNMCGVAPNAGGNPGQSVCKYMNNDVDVSGGSGGNGINGTMGGPGLDGNPLGATGKGGKPQDANGSCDPGGKGIDGVPGIEGDGARGFGDIDNFGFHGPLATKGASDGSPGQGGGGGGGAKKCVGGGAGPGGGGGGAGGCGGVPGNPGQSGGSSIGILALSAKLTLKNVTITTKDGGSGGLGGDGQSGAAGGQPGAAGGANACPGNIGGAGGRGGSGGGGAGGHSIGIAMKGGMMPALDTTTIKTGKGALGAIGGDMDMTPQAKGDDGKACTVLDFTDLMSPTACMK